MKSLVLATALFSLPAFAGNYSVRCTAEAELSEGYNIIYEAWGTQDVESENAAFLSQDGFMVSVKKYDIEHDSYETFLAEGSLVFVPDENCSENCEVANFNVPESVKGLSMTYHAADKSISVRHVWGTKKVIEAQGMCTVEKAIVDEQQQQQQQQQGDEGSQGQEDDGGQSQGDEGSQGEGGQG